MGWAAFLQHPVEGSHVVPWEAFALVFAPDDIPQFFQILQRRVVVIGPLGVRGDFGLKLPAAAKSFGAHLAFFPLGGGGFPDVDVSHAESFFGWSDRGLGSE